MKRSIKLDALLQGMEKATDFGGGDAGRVWERARARNGRRRPKLAWLIPAAAAVTVLVTLLTIPPVRAGMFGFFGKLFGIMDYLNTDEDSRPENTALAALIKRDVPAVVKITPAPGDGNGWVNELKLRIDEAVCDGHSVTLKLSIACAEIDSLEPLRAPTERGGTIHYKEFDFRSIEVKPGQPPRSSSGHSRTEKIGDGQWVATVQFYSDEYNLAEMTEFRLPITLYNSTVSTDGDGQVKESSSRAGEVEMTFSLDASAGAESARTVGGLDGTKQLLRGDVIVTEMRSGNASNTFINRRVSLNGAYFSVKSVVWTPVETRVRVRLSAARSIHDSMGLHLELLDGERVVGTMAGGSGDGNTMEYDIVAPFLPSNVGKLTVRAMLDYYTECNGEKLRPDKALTVAFSDSFTYKTTEQELCTMEIDMTK